MNSVLQQFYMIEPFRKSIISVCDNIPPNIK